MGAQELASLAATMEQLGASGDTTGASEIQAQAVDAFAAVKSELEAELQVA